MKTGRDGWPRCEISRDELGPLMERSDRRGLANLALFIGLLIALGVAAWLTLGTPWALLFFWLYGSVYGFSISILHETHHGTPFRSKRLNEAVHLLAGFLTLRNPQYDRRMHTRHHAETGDANLDSELAHPNPINSLNLLLDLFWLRAAIVQPWLLMRQLSGRFTEYERKVLPSSERPVVRRQAAMILAFYAALAAIAVVERTWLPLVYTYLAHIYGGLIPRLYALTQHVGMAHEEQDFRLNTRTCIYNQLAAALYWNMNYHIEHHMFPLVPFHALPRLHVLLRPQMPQPKESALQAWRDILTCMQEQRSQPDYCIRPNVCLADRPAERLSARFASE